MTKDCARFPLPRLFVHAPRPAFTPPWLTSQRWYAGGGSGRQLRSATNGCEIDLSTTDGTPFGELSISTLRGADDFRIYATLRPDTMRELARCLIDGAAHLDRAAAAAAATPAQPVGGSAA